MSFRRSRGLAGSGAAPRRRALLPALAALTLLAGCSAAQLDRLPAELGGLPEGAPQRPAQSPAFPAVHDMPPPRPATLLDAEQQKKLEADLLATRNRLTKTPGQKGKAAGQAAAPEAGKSNKSKKKRQREGGAGQGGLPAPLQAGAGRNP